MPETNEKPAANGKEAEVRIPLDVDKEPIVTEHRIEIDGKPFAYTATCGMLPILNETGEAEAGMFFVYYRRAGDGDPADRPLMISFNGGPGSSSVWLHLGVVGPKRAPMNPDGSLPAPPYRLVDNPDTWLRDCDLVFVDPVGTGYSRPAKPDGGEKFWGLKGDIESVGEFIRLFLTRFERWASPLYMVGESYGTTRASGLAGYLIDRGIAFSGILLVSSILNFQTARFLKGNDLPYVLFLPTYCATAWYHGKLPKDLQSKPLADVLKLAESFALGPYHAALARGSLLSGAERKRIAVQLARFSGLRREYVEQADLRIQIMRFCKELLRAERRTVGRLDSRFKGIDFHAVAETPEHDPSMSAIRPPYTAMLNDYVRRSLQYKNDAPYHILGGERKLWETWNWGNAGEGLPDTSEALRAAMSKNPHMRVFVASGYYDLATPYFATEFTLAHLGLDSSLEPNVTTHYYEAGHMMYIEESCLAKLRRDVAAFLVGASMP